MKNKVFLLIWLWPVLISAQGTLLSEALVVDSTLRISTIGYNVSQPDGNTPNGDLGQALAGKSPLVINQAAPNLLANYYLRGAYSDGVKVLWNGMPVSSPTLGLTDMNLLNPSSVGSVQVLPGGFGAALGSGAIGGAVFLNSPQLRLDNQHSVLTNVGAGSNGFLSSSNSITESGKNWAVQFGTFYDGAENDYSFLDGRNRPQQRVNNAYYRYGSTLNSLVKLGESLLQTNILVQDLYRQIPAPSSGINASNPANAWQSDAVYRIQNVLTTKGWRFEAGFNQENQVYSNARSTVFSKNNFTQFSGEVQRTILENNSVSLNVSAYLNAYTAFGSNVNDAQNEYGLRANWRQALTSKLSYQVSLSSDFIDAKSVKALDTTSVLNVPVLPAVSIIYKLPKGLRLRAGASEVFNNPTLNERFWPEAGVEDIQPEYGYSAELGLDHVWSKNSWSSEAHATGFYTILNNRIRWLSSQGLFRPQNISQSNAYGVELAHTLNYNGLKNWLFRISYNANYTRAIVLKDAFLGEISEGNQLINIPEWTGGVGVASQHKGLKMSVFARFNSGAYTTADNDEFLKVDGFAVINASTSYCFIVNKFEFIPSVQVLNLANRTYETLNFQPMPGTQFFFNVSLKYQL